MQQCVYLIPERNVDICRRITITSHMLTLKYAEFYLFQYETQVQNAARLDIWLAYNSYHGGVKGICSFNLIPTDASDK